MDPYRVKIDSTILHPYFIETGEMNVMKPIHVTTRFIAILLLVIPGIMATMGFLFMKNIVFDYMVGYGDDNLATPKFQWFPFIFGLLLFITGIGFISGWIHFRDRKHNYVCHTLPGEATKTKSE